MSIVVEYVLLGARGSYRGRALCDFVTNEKAIKLSRIVGRFTACGRKRNRYFSSRFIFVVLNRAARTSVHRQWCWRVCMFLSQVWGLWMAFFSIVFSSTSSSSSVGLCRVSTCTHTIRHTNFSGQPSVSFFTFPFRIFFFSVFSFVRSPYRDVWVYGFLRALFHTIWIKNGIH